ncbi:MAG: tetratricopeptide repeat protein, partial [bacterium]
DPTNAFARSEAVFSSGWKKAAVLKLNQATAAHPQSFLELATEYMALGAWKETSSLLQHAQSLVEDVHPLVYYYRAVALEQLGEREQARKILKQVSSRPFQIYIFPFRRETISVLESALEIDPKDANAASLLGDLLYDRSRQEEGMSLWKRAVATDPDHYQSLRNLGWALLEKGQVESALPALEHAADLRPDDLEIINGVTQLYSRLGRGDDAVRVVRAALGKRPENDQLIELMARAEAFNGDYDEALGLLGSHQFGPRHQSYSILRLYQSIELLKVYELASKGEFEQALEHLRGAENTPANLGVDNFVALKSSRLLFFAALIHHAAGASQSADASWRSAAETSDHDYNGQGLFRAIALANIGRTDEAEEWVEVFERISPQRQKDNTARVRTEAFYLAGIYSLFKGDESKGREQLLKAIQSDESNLFARHALLWLDAGLFEGISLGS